MKREKQRCSGNKKMSTEENIRKIAAIILENEHRELLLYRRDNKPGIPFPGHWDLIGGHVENGETPEKALVREVKEELDLDLKEFSFFKKYECFEGDAYPNIKYIYYGKINLPVEKITLLEGDIVRYFKREEIADVKFANILKGIVLEYLSAGF
ncbi:MAG TPA: NUDIX domain-containing protein [Bacteroidales bacterium]|nr:NUDIX domain-containing protein [Bacteroidales bacterium]